MIRPVGGELGKTIERFTDYLRLERGCGENTQRATARTCRYGSRTAGDERPAICRPTPSPLPAGTAGRRKNRSSVWGDAPLFRALLQYDG
ncbi:MAG: hypothetical protein ACLUEQ_08995 [Cloacibacillus evryensis]